MFFGPVNLFNYPKQWRDYRMFRTQDEMEEIMVSDHAKAMQQAGGIDATLQERGNRYGPFDGHAMITQTLKEVMNSSVDGVNTNWESLDASKKEALEMIAHKIGRILNGDPNYIDSFRDIAGYAMLVVSILENKEGATDSETIHKRLKNGTWEKVEK